MAQTLRLPIAGALAIAGIGAGIHLGHSALAEINPIYYQTVPTRFHSDLVPNSSSTPAPIAALAQTEAGAALGNGCIGCRAYPEEYIPIHDASVDAEPALYAMEGGKVRLAAVEEEVDPDAARLNEAIQRVELYARGAEDAGAAIGSATEEAQADPLDEGELVTQ